MVKYKDALSLVSLVRVIILVSRTTAEEKDSKQTCRCSAISVENAFFL